MNSQYRIPSPLVPFSPPSYICKRAVKPFTLDGNINKEFWADVLYTDDFIDIEGSHMPVPRFRTRAKMQWDDDNLYIAALLEGNEIWANITDRDAVIFYDNDFELFIDPDSDTQQYIEFEMNALNTIWDLLLTKAYRDNGKPVNGFDLHGLQTAVHIDGSLNVPSKDTASWSVEIVIPFQSITEVSDKKSKPDDGDYYRINFSRVQWLTEFIDGTFVKKLNPQTNRPYPEDNWVWAPTGVINIHYPELWGFVFFSDTDSQQKVYEIPKDEYKKWQLRKLYYAEHQYFDDHQAFTTDPHLLSSDDLSGFTIECTMHSFEISCSDCAGTGVLSIFHDGKTMHDSLKRKE